MKKNNIFDIHIYFFVILLTFLNLLFVYVSRIGFNYEFIPLLKSSLTFIFLIFTFEIFKIFKLDIFYSRFIYNLYLK